MCTVLLLPGVNSIAVNKYISYYIIYIHKTKYSVISTNAKNVADYPNVTLNIVLRYISLDS